MKEYTGDKIRNVAIVGHGGSGTTSLTEALLYRSGAISRMCKVEDGQTTTDYEPEEIKRGVSVNATLAPVEWNDTKINFIDTPGFADFVAEVSQNAIEVCIFTIHLIYENNTRQTSFFSQLPALFSTNLYTAGSANNDQCTINSTESTFNLCYEISKARGIDKVNLSIIPFYRS